MADILRARMLAIACGYEDADDLDILRRDPGLQAGLRTAAGQRRRSVLAADRVALGERADLREVVRLTLRHGRSLLRQLRAVRPRRSTLDIDDTCDVVHGHQQLSLFNAHYDERCFLPIHVYDTATRPPGGGAAAAGQDAVRRRESAAICAAWSAASARHWPEHPHHHPRRRPLRPPRGDGVVRGQWRRLRLRPSGNAAASRQVEPVADDVRVRRAERTATGVRGYTETRYGAKSWSSERRVAARIEATRLGPRHPLRRHQPRAWRSAEWLYDDLYCAADRPRT